MRTLYGILASLVLLGGCGSAPVFRQTGATPSVRLEILAADTVPGPSRIRMPIVDGSGQVSGRETFVYVDSIPVFANADVLEARVLEFEDVGHRKEFSVELTLTASAKARFAEFTASRVGRPVAFVIEGRLVSAPFVAERIPGGKCQILVEGMGVERATQMAQGIVDTSSFRWPHPMVAPLPIPQAH